MVKVHFLKQYGALMPFKYKFICDLRLDSCKLVRKSAKAPQQNVGTKEAATDDSEKITLYTRANENRMRGGATKAQTEP